MFLKLSRRNQFFANEKIDFFLPFLIEMVLDDFNWPIVGSDRKRSTRNRRRKKLLPSYLRVLLEIPELLEMILISLRNCQNIGPHQMLQLRLVCHVWARQIPFIPFDGKIWTKWVKNPVIVRNDFNYFDNWDGKSTKPNQKKKKDLLRIYTIRDKSLLSCFVY